MRVVLGIDAAWTDKNPSGVALAQKAEAGWRLVRVESSYGRFVGRDNGDAPPRGDAPDVLALIEACRRCASSAPELVAVDMPLALTQIVGRRASDIAISRAFGAAKASTHSPSVVRPGPLSDKLRADFQAAGFGLCTAARPVLQGLMEVYPHVALLALTGDAERLTYKASKTATYWKGVELFERRARLRAVWLRIVAALETEIAGVAEALPPPGPEVRGQALKAYEDKLDAVICAYVAIAALEGRARAYGDADSAIWVPVS